MILLSSKILNVRNIRIIKKLSQNVKSRIPIRLSKFLVVLCTPTGAFSNTKKSCFEPLFFRVG